MTRRRMLAPRHLHALDAVIDSGRRVADALADDAAKCRTTAEKIRLAEAFSQVAEEVCNAIALEAELVRQPQEPGVSEPPGEPALKPRMH